MDELFDLVVVGAGSAGAVIAARASEDPRRSVLASPSEFAALRQYAPPVHDVSAHAFARLTVRVRLWFELRVPLVNAAFLLGWLPLPAAAAPREGLPAASPSERTAVAALAAAGHGYFLPLEATWSARPQSSLYRKWVTP